MGRLDVHHTDDLRDPHIRGWLREASHTLMQHRKEVSLEDNKILGVYGSTDFFLRFHRMRPFAEDADFGPKFVIFRYTAASVQYDQRSVKQRCEYSDFDGAVSLRAPIYRITSLDEAEAPWSCDMSTIIRPVLTWSHVSKDL